MLRGSKYVLLHLRVWRTLSNRVKMRATPQTAVFQHPAKTKAWHPQFECQAFELPTTHLPYGGSCFEIRIGYINKDSPCLCSIFQEKDVLHLIRKNRTMSTKKLGKTFPFLEKYFPNLQRLNVLTLSKKKKSITNFNRYSEQGHSESNWMVR